MLSLSINPKVKGQTVDHDSIYRIEIFHIHEILILLYVSVYLILLLVNVVS